MLLTLAIYSTNVLTNVAFKNMKAFKIASIKYNISPNGKTLKNRIYEGIAKMLATG